MSAATESDVELGLVEKAKRVLPGGSFGNRLCQTHSATFSRKDAMYAGALGGP